MGAYNFRATRFTSLPSPVLGSAENRVQISWATCSPIGRFWVGRRTSEIRKQIPKIGKFGNLDSDISATLRKGGPTTPRRFRPKNGARDLAFRGGREGPRLRGQHNHQSADFGLASGSAILVKNFRGSGVSDSEISAAIRTGGTTTSRSSRPKNGVRDMACQAGWEGPRFRG